MGKRVVLSGLGFEIPETLVTTEEVCTYIGVPDWSTRFEQMFLMHERPLWWEHGAPKQVEWPGATLAIAAGRQALQRAGVSSDDVTHHFHISCTTDRTRFQAEAYRVMAQLGLSRASLINFDLGCGGIAPAIYHSAVLLSVGAARNVLITAANSTSPYMVFREEYKSENEWFPLAMFNDSAGAIVLSAVDDGRVGPAVDLRKTIPYNPRSEGIDADLKSKLPQFAHLFLADDGSSPNGSLLLALCAESGSEPLLDVLEGGANQPKGNPLYRLRAEAVKKVYGPCMLENLDIATKEIPKMSVATSTAVGTGMQEIPKYHPARARLTAVHQANGNVVRQLRDALALGNEPHRVPIRTMHLGNSVSASTIEVLMDAQQNHRLRDGDIIAVMTIGAGMSTGGAIFRWGSI